MSDIYNVLIMVLIGLLTGLIVYIICLIIKSTKMRNDTFSELADIKTRIGNTVSINYLSNKNNGDLNNDTLFNMPAAMRLDDTRLIMDDIEQESAMLVYAGRQYMLRDHKFYVGRAVENDIVILGAYVSRIHFIIVKNEKEYLLENRSSNGVVINGRMIREQEYRLQNKDCIEIPGVEEKMLFFEAVD